MIKKILLTGSSGFLGSYILDFLVNKNYEVLKIIYWVIMFLDRTYL